MSSNSTDIASSVDVVLIGGGVMSATLGTLLRQLQPDWKISIYERLDTVAEESSNAWNNAGTGHSALCELNYTPQGADGKVDISKAVAVNEQFQVSRQFWAYLVENGVIPAAGDFLTAVPHMSFVWGPITWPSCVSGMRRCPLTRYLPVWIIRKTVSRLPSGHR